MGNVIVRIEGLSVFFLEKLLDDTGDFLPKGSLMVGLVKVDESLKLKNITPPAPAKDDRHVPKIRIYRLDGVQESVKFFKKQEVMEGNYSFQKEKGGAGVKNYSLINAGSNDIKLSQQIKKGLKVGGGPAAGKKNAWQFRSKRDYFRPEGFEIVRIKRLYANNQVKFDPGRCQALVSLDDGALFSMDVRHDWTFVSYKGMKPEKHPDISTQDVSIYNAIELTSNKNNKLTLVCDKNPNNNYTFDPALDYEVTITNISAVSHKDKNHFLYYYSISNPIPDVYMAPLGEHGPAPESNPFCAPIAEP